ncbi:MAG TPA: VOC family protein [Gemmatimonadales bacterium]|nr:VOC family protein [Gemmatimonadales bacterium]
MRPAIVFAAIAAGDLAVSVEFYRSLLGREPDLKTRDIYVEFHLPGLRLGIFSPRESHRDEFAGASGALSLVLAVPDIEQAHAEFSARNSARRPGPLVDASYGREFYGYDPDGNRLIVVELVSG